MSGKRIDDQRAIKLFENKTGRFDYTMDDVAKWIEEHNVMPMPEPQTPRQLLAERLSGSAGNARRADPDSPVPYRAYHATRIEKGGQWAWSWFDADGPAATEARMHEATRPRREQMLNIGVQVAADMRHFYKTHPAVTPKQLDFDLTWEIDLRLGNEDEGEGRKAG